MTMSVRKYRIEAKYDRFTDRTRVFLYAMPVAPPTRKASNVIGDPLNMSVEFFFNGRVLIDSPPKLKLQLVAHSERDLGKRVTPQYERDHNLIFLLDDQTRFDLGPGTYEADSSSRDEIFEIMRYEITAAMLKQIADASVVEGRLGSTEFTLDADHRAALSEVVVRTDAHGYEAAEAALARENMRRSATLASRYPEATLLERALSQIAESAPDLWPEEIERVLASLPVGDCVRAVFSFDNPTLGVIAATDSRVVQVFCMEPSLIANHVDYQDMTQITYYADPSGTIALLSFVALTEDGEKPLGAVIGQENRYEAEQLISFVSRVTSLPVE